MDGYRGSESRTSSETSELTGYESGELAPQVLSSETLSLSLLGYVVADFVFIDFNHGWMPFWFTFWRVYDFFIFS